MKRIFYLFFVAVAFFACSKDSVETLPGRIAGSVSDKTTGEPVATVNVSLSPGGQSTVTGNDGTFSFEWKKLNNSPKNCRGILRVPIFIYK